MSITVTTQAELDAVVDSDEIIIIESDGLFEIRGTSKPNIRTHDTSKPTIKTYDDSKPSIGTFDMSKPTIRAYGMSMLSIWTFDDVSVPIVRIYGTTARVYVDGTSVDRPPLSEDVQMPKTQGDKDKKPEQMSRVPVAPLLKLSKHFFKGSQKYNDISPGVANWSLGVPWSSSYDALQRHLLNWWNGEDLDEDGNENLVAAMWHVCVLLEFTETHPELDDRPKRGGASADE